MRLMRPHRDISIGIAGWSYPDWEGIVYPKSSIDKLAFAADLVDCIEINSTFYRLPDRKNSASWLGRVEGRKDFFFTAKLHQTFTHERILDPLTAEQFKEGLRPLLEADRLHRLLIQFRYDFASIPENKEYLRKLIDVFGDVFSIVVEVRHHSWQLSESLEFLKRMKTSVCNLDYPLGPNSFDLDETISPDGYMRLHGRNREKWFSKSTRDEIYDYVYNQSELREIFGRIEKLADRCQTYTVIANNHYKGAALANALELKYLLTGLKQPIPEGLLQRYPLLSEIAQNPNLF
jgi:uncharacterized protein YecE (DUF72 family)